MPTRASLILLMKFTQLVNDFILMCKLEHQANILLPFQNNFCCHGAFFSFVLFFWKALSSSIIWIFFIHIARGLSNWGLEVCCAGCVNTPLLWGKLNILRVPLNIFRNVCYKHWDSIHLQEKSSFLTHYNDPA